MTRLLLRFSDKVVENPVTAQVILEKKLLLSIVAANIDSQGGTIIIEVPSTDKEKAADAFREKGVTVTLPKLIEVDSEKCFDCGACVSYCPVKAISLKKDYGVAFDLEKCIGSYCGLCVNACPARAISIFEKDGTDQNGKRKTF